MSDLDTTALVAVPDGALDASPAPVFTGQQMALAFRAYLDLQRALDDAMPDAILVLGDGRKFRKKAYWRAVAVAFNLTVEPIDERRAADGVFLDGNDNFGYLVNYRATTRGGRSSTGDGACFALEKVPKYEANRWAKLPREGSVHNVRSHAHTRAYNRAVSNLCGFGEVSAEEVERDDTTWAPTGSGDGPPVAAAARPVPPRTPTNPAPSNHDAIISEPQRRRLIAKSMEGGFSIPEREALLRSHGFAGDGADVTRTAYDGIIATLLAGPDGTRGA